MKIAILPDEKWYGGAAAEGAFQPYTDRTRHTLDFSLNRTPNQQMPLLLSTAGRYVYAPGAKVTFEEGALLVPDSAVFETAGANLREAYLAARDRFFPFSGGTPDKRLFRQPVYNTWIEFTFDQNQDGILRYARDLLSYGLPPGVLMIDDGWSDYYGRWTFAASKFSSPELFIAELRELGFSVMLWVCPFITPDTVEYRYLEKEDLLVKQADGRPYIANWWNGWSAVLDMTKAGAREFLDRQLEALRAMGVEGFKFDAGDSVYYPDDGEGLGDVQSAAWAAYGEKFPLNEYRVTCNSGGRPLMQRQCDKHHSWDERGLGALIPSGIVQSLTGHPWLCPDMIGGGEYKSFIDLDILDEMLFVRWAQIACLMPVMQFSAAPWRVLSPENYARVLAAVRLRGRYTDRIMALLDSGEPILRPMAYVFGEDPACGALTDQFMLGDDVLVAPLTDKASTLREVYVPAGRWQDQAGDVYTSRGEWLTLDGDLRPVVLERAAENS